MNVYIQENVKTILNTLPPDVLLEAAAKTRTLDQVNDAIASGINILGYNYVQEAEIMYRVIGSRVKWHMIGNLQKNKVNKAVKIFDMIETIDSVELAFSVNKACENIKKTMLILIEINSGREKNKTGVLEENVKTLVDQICELPFIKIKGLMTMGPWCDDPEELRPYFRKTKKLFDLLKEKDIHNVEMQYLSMGMSDSYKIAIEEGANIVRLGTSLFGPRNSR